MSVYNTQDTKFAKPKVRPLTIITTYNRFEVTRQMLASLEPSLSLLEVVVVDNGSIEAGMVDWLIDWALDKEDVLVYELPQNIGCPRALNLAMSELRQPGQAVIKLDNDILMPDNGAWLGGVERLTQYYKNKYHTPVALVGAYYEPWNQERVRFAEQWAFHELYYITPVIGHAVYHTGEFLDQVGYFDVLHHEHLYGFEDNVISYKAETMGWATLAWAGWQIENIQRHSALGDRQAVDTHVAQMRPYYNQRLSLIKAGGSLYTNAAGMPERRA